MLLGGLQKFSLIDYPGKMCAIVFTAGCNFRCGYCHNPELVKNPRGLIEEKEFFDFLKKRQGQLEAVTITGGEPTLHFDLVEFIEKTKKLGFLVKLDSNGTNPNVLKKIIEKKVVDYLAMDIKGPLNKYQEITNSTIDTDKIQQSIKLIRESGIDYEFRTTVVESQLSREDILTIGKLIKGAKRYYLQKFIPTKTVNPEFMKAKTYSEKEFARMQGELKEWVEKCEVR